MKQRHGSHGFSRLRFALVRGRGLKRHVGGVCVCTTWFALVRGRGLKLLARQKVGRSPKFALVRGRGLKRL